MARIVVAVAEDENAVLEILQDEDAESPREWDNLGHMICWHSRYNLGDKHEYEDPKEFLKTLVFQFTDKEMSEIHKMDNNDLLSIIREHAVILPLYLYDHGGITMNTTGFSCLWDSGHVGWIYVTHDEIVKEYGSLEIEKARSVLEAEVQAYDQYLRGNIYGFELKEKVKCECCGHIEYENIDSCYGFYGDLNELKEQLKSHLDKKYADLIDKLEWAS